MTKKPKKPTPQEKYFDEQKDQGFTRVTAWVPPENRTELLNIAKEMRDDFLRKGESE